MTYALISGAIAMGCVVAAFFFFQFWRGTKDRLFILFATSFGILMLERVIPILLRSEHNVLQYIVRALAFILILAAILDKNLKNHESNEP